MSQQLIELERIAYIKGDPISCVFADIMETMTDEDSLEDILQTAKDTSFEEGKAAGMGIDAAKRIAELENELMEVKESHSRIRANFQAVQSWLKSDDSRTVALRKVYAERMRVFLMNIPCH